MEQYISEVTTVSTKGQIVLPKAIRTHLNLNPGAKLMVFTDGENILLKPITIAPVEEFAPLLDAAEQWAKNVGLNESDINDAIKTVRQRKRGNA